MACLHSSFNALRTTLGALCLAFPVGSHAGPIASASDWSQLNLIETTALDVLAAVVRLGSREGTWVFRGSGTYDDSGWRATQAGEYNGGRFEMSYVGTTDFDAGSAAATGSGSLDIASEAGVVAPRGGDSWESHGMATLGIDILGKSRYALRVGGKVEGGRDRLNYELAADCVVAEIGGGQGFRLHCGDDPAIRLDVGYESPNGRESGRFKVQESLDYRPLVTTFAMGKTVKEEVPIRIRDVRWDVPVSAEYRYVRSETGRSVTWTVSVAGIRIPESGTLSLLTAAALAWIGWGVGSGRAKRRQRERRIACALHSASAWSTSAPP